jgi:hypothetical protein
VFDGASFLCGSKVLFLFGGLGQAGAPFGGKAQRFLGVYLVGGQGLGSG